MARKTPVPPARETSGDASPRRRGRPPKTRTAAAGTAARRGAPGKNSAADAPPRRTKAAAKATQKRPPGRPKASPASAPSGRGRKAGAAELTKQIQQILDQLSALRGIQTAMKALDAKLEAVLRQVEARGARDPADAVGPAWPCSSRNR